MHVFDQKNKTTENSKRKWWKISIELFQKNQKKISLSGRCGIHNFQKPTNHKTLYSFSHWPFHSMIFFLALFHHTESFQIFVVRLYCNENKIKNNKKLKKKNEKREIVYFAINISLSLCLCIYLFCFSYGHMKRKLNTQIDISVLAANESLCGTISTILIEFVWWNQQAAATTTKNWIYSEYR